MRHRRRTAAQGSPPILASTSLVPPTALQRRSRSPAPRPPRSIQAFGLRCSLCCLSRSAFTPRIPSAPSLGTLSAVREPLRFICPQPPRLFPVIFPPPLSLSPHPAPQWRSRPPLERHVSSANHSHPLASTSVFSSCRTGALPSARWPRRPLCAEFSYYPYASSRPGLPRGRGAGGGPFPTDAAWGVTRGFFENLTVGARVLDLPAAFRLGHYTWRPHRSRPHKDGG